MIFIILLKPEEQANSTLKEISETLGKETIDLYNTSDTRGTSQSYGLNYQKTGFLQRMTKDIHTKKCLQIFGEK